MCLPYPREIGIDPFLNRMGYKIENIEKSFPLDTCTIKLLETVGIRRKSIKPELVLKSEENILLFECKTVAFDASLENSSFIQANCYLSTKKQYINYLISSETAEKGQICYFVPDLISDDIRLILNQIKSKYIKDSADFLEPVIMTSNLDTENEILNVTTRLLDKDESTFEAMDMKKVEDPNFFNLLLYNPGRGITEKNSEHIMLRTQAVLLRLLGTNLESAKQFSIKIEEIVKEVAQFYKYLEKDEQKKLKSHIVIKLKKMFNSIDGKKEKIRVTNSEVVIDVLTAKEGRNLLKDAKNFKINQEMALDSSSRQLELEL